MARIAYLRATYHTELLASFDGHPSAFQVATKQQLKDDDNDDDIRVFLLLCVVCHIVAHLLLPLRMK